MDKVLYLMLIGAGAAVVYGTGCAITGTDPKNPMQLIEKVSVDWFGKVDETAISEAEKNVKVVLTSAQNTFIHRTGGRMAASIDELGPGFKTGQHGALINEEIWIARLGAQQETGPVAESVLKKPYRYAVLPVRNLNGEEKDLRTTCVIAVPVKNGYPALVMLAGPIVNDPLDFRKPWTVHRLDDPNMVKGIRDAAESKRSIDKELARAFGLFDDQTSKK